MSIGGRFPALLSASLVAQALLGFGTAPDAMILAITSLAPFMPISIFFLSVFVAVRKSIKQ